MLRELVVENLGVIERVDVELAAGSTALTGETGAGKTLLVSALGLLLGGRADRGAVRHGAPEARVTARFEVGAGHPSLEVLGRHDLLAPDPAEIVITRTVAEGGGKVRVNGRLATVSLLAELGPSLVEIAGQHEHQRLTSRRAQTDLLDAFAGEDTVRLSEEVAHAVREATAAARRLEELESGRRDRERELDVLRYEIGEIERVGPRAGESEELQAEAARLEHAEAIGSAIQAASLALEGDSGAVEGLSGAASALEKVADKDPRLSAVIERLQAVVVEAEDVAREVAALSPAGDEGQIDSLRARLADLVRLQRKYGSDDAEVVAYVERARARVAELEGGSFDIERLEEEATRAHARALELAKRLSAARAAAASALATAVEELLAALAMAGTNVEVALEPGPLHETGLEIAELKIGSPGQPPRPVAKVASGGELSRIALALRLAAGRSASFASTVVFDEVDAGVGGEAARSVGRCLADLARSAGVQVLVVTHLPQVAAFADSHHRVTKVAEHGSTRALIEVLQGEDRVAEVSRMLAGLPGSDTAREHAQELLEIAATA